MHGSFLQSPEWENLNQQMGRKTWRIAGVLVVRHDIPYGSNYLYCPRPEFKTIENEDFFSQALHIAKIEKSLFLKIDAREKIPVESMYGVIEEGSPLQPQETIVLDVSKSEDELLRNMREKTRYNIRLAERKDIEVIQTLNQDAKEDVDVFWNLLLETADRGGFYSHEKKYYESIFRTRTNEMSNEFFFARMRGSHKEVLAVALVNIYRDPHTGRSIATYLHGASSRDHRELMAPHLLHWRIIQEAKWRSIDYYDLWGIDEKRWTGVTRFKTGFGGSRVIYPPSLHVIYRPVWYRMYKIMRQRTKRS